MRPHKFVTLASSGRTTLFPQVVAQQVLDTQLLRLAAPWGEVPVVVTSELDAINLLYWSDERGGAWHNHERAHAALTTPVGATDAMNTWNWSRRVGLTALRDRVFMVYKREVGTVGLVVEEFGPDETGRRRLVARGSVRVPLGDLGLAATGFSLWAGVDAARGELLVLTQARRLLIDGTLGEWRLTLLRGPADVAVLASSPGGGGVPSFPGGHPPGLPARTPWRLVDIDAGGYDLDVRSSGRALVMVYRRTAEAVHVPLPFAHPDPFGITVREVALESGPELDVAYRPLSLTSFDLGTGQVSSEQIAGGEHPQIQGLEPLLVTFDRHRGAILRFSLVGPDPRRPGPVVSWQPGLIAKMAFVRGGEGDFRGEVLSFDARTLPRSFGPLRGARDHVVFGPTGADLCAPVGANVVFLLQAQEREKLLLIDLLHHQPRFALVRSRLGLQLSDGAITVESRTFDVWDIGHAQIDDPDRLDPVAAAENRQFAPFLVGAGSGAGNVQFPAYRLDNTMGGALGVAGDHDPQTFFAYTDLGDGGLRVVYDDQIPAPGDPPVAEPPKDLVLEMVSGPGSPADAFVEVTAGDWIASGLPGYPLQLGGPLIRTIGSSLHVRLDLLLDGVALFNRSLPPDRAPIDTLAGMSVDELNELQAFINARVGPSGPFTLTSAGVGTARFTVDPARLVSNSDLAFTLDQPETPGTTVLWTFVPHPRFGALVPGPVARDSFDFDPITSHAELGASVTARLPTAGDWRVSVFVIDAAGQTLSFSRDVEVAQSVGDILWDLHDAIADGDFHRIGDLQLSVLKYELQFTTTEQGEPDRVAIHELPKQDTELRFVASGMRQGTLDYRARIRLATEDVKLKRGLDLAFAITRLDVELLYRRPFTPGVLMVDRRDADPLTGDDLGDFPQETTLRQETNRLHVASIGAKPSGDTEIASATVTPRVSINLATVGVVSIVTALGILGAASVAAFITALLGLLATALAIGVAGAAIAVSASATLFVVLTVVVPKEIAKAVKQAAEAQLRGLETKRSLDDAHLLQYAGEGAAEAVARQILAAASATPATETNDQGFDRNRGQSYQMIVVTEGKCRVLVRGDD